MVQTIALQLYAKTRKLQLHKYWQSTVTHMLLSARAARIVYLKNAAQEADGSFKCAYDRAKNWQCTCSTNLCF